jgi:hypothetical protein
LIDIPSLYIGKVVTGDPSLHPASQPASTMLSLWSTS